MAEHENDDIQTGQSEDDGGRAADRAAAEVANPIEVTPDGYLIAWGFTDGDNRRGKSGLIVAFVRTGHLTGRSTPDKIASMAKTIAVNVASEYRLGVVYDLGHVALFEQDGDVTAVPSHKELTDITDIDAASRILASGYRLTDRKRCNLDLTVWFDGGSSLPSVYSVDSPGPEYFDQIGM